MTDLRTLMTDFRRPAMLLRAARLGLQDFHRERDLKRLLRMDCTAGPKAPCPGFSMPRASWKKPVASEMPAIRCAGI